MIPRPRDGRREIDGMDITEIDKKIRQCLYEVARLRRRRNELAPPSSRLPSDLLANCFLFLRDSSLQQNATDGHLGFIDSKWLSVTGVSQKWRTVALDEPRLWTHIDSNIAPNPDDQSSRLAFVRKCLQRAKALPIRYHINIVDEARILSILLADRARISNLSASSLISATAMNVLRGQYPALSSLSLGPVSIYSPQNLFSDPCPSLTHFSWHMSLPDQAEGLSWSGYIFPNLTHLDLACPAWSEFITGALSSLTKVQSISLKIDKIFGSGPCRQDMLSLKDLTRFRLSGFATVKQMSQCLSYFRFGPQTSLHIMLDSPSGEGSLFRVLPAERVSTICARELFNSLVACLGRNRSIGHVAFRPSSSQSERCSIQLYEKGTNMLCLSLALPANASMSDWAEVYISHMLRSYKFSHYSLEALSLDADAALVDVWVRHYLNPHDSNAYPVASKLERVNILHRADVAQQVIVGATFTLLQAIGGKQIVLRKQAI